MLQTTTISVILSVVLSVGAGSGVTAQALLDGPECVAFDSVRNRYLVTNTGDGLIVQIDSNLVSSYWGVPSGFTLGNVIADGTFFFTADNANTIGLDLETGHPNWFFLAPGGGDIILDGLAADTAGYLYVLEMMDPKIYKIRISDTSATILVSSGLPEFPQEIYYDARHDRLVVGSWCTDAPVLAVDVKTGVITTLVASTIGWHDGITMDPEGNIYLGCEAAGQVIMYDSTFANPPVTIMSGLGGPSGLDFNWRDRVLAVPCSGSNTIVFIDMTDSDGDCIPDLVDNCPSVINLNQADSDADSVGNACDNCLEEPNPGQLDLNGNSIGDACEGCCGFWTAGITGNANCSEDGKLTLSDITKLIDRVYISKESLCCEATGNTNGSTDCKITLSDITVLIDAVFISKSNPENCMLECEL